MRNRSLMTTCSMRSEHEKHRTRADPAPTRSTTPQNEQPRLRGAAR